MFCSPGTKVIEIFSPEYVNVLYWGLSSLQELDYYYMLGEGRRDYQQSFDAKADIEIETRRLTALLELARLL